jgi:hypothetical protein
MRGAVREVLPYFIASMAILLLAATYLWWTAPPDNTLPEDYGVM